MATEKFQTELVIKTAGNEQANANRIQEAIRARIAAEHVRQQAQAAALNAQALAAAAPMQLTPGASSAAAPSQPVSRYAAQKLRATLRQQVRAQLQAEAAYNAGTSAASLVADVPELVTASGSVSPAELGAASVSRYARQRRLAAERLTRQGGTTRSVFTTYPQVPEEIAPSAYVSDYVRAPSPQWGPLRAMVDSLSPIGAGIARFGGTLRSRLGGAASGEGTYSPEGRSSGGFLARLRRQLAGISAAFRMRSSPLGDDMGTAGYGQPAAPVTEYAAWSNKPLSPLGDATSSGMNSASALQMTAQLAANPMVAAAAAQAAANTPQARQNVASNIFPAMLARLGQRLAGGRNGRALGGPGAPTGPGGTSSGMFAYAADDDSSGYTFEPFYGRFILPTPRPKLPRPGSHLPARYQPNFPATANNMPQSVPPYWRYWYPGPPPLQLGGPPAPPGPPGTPAPPGSPSPLLLPGPTGPTMLPGPPMPPGPPRPPMPPGPSPQQPSPMRGLVIEGAQLGLKHLYKRGLQLQQLADPIYAEMEPVFARELHEMQSAGVYRREDLAGEQEDFTRLRLAMATPGEDLQRSTKDTQGNRINYTSMSDRMDETGEVLTDLATQRMAAIRRHLQPFMGFQEGMRTYSMFRRNAGVIDMTSEEAASIIGTGLQSGLDPTIMATASRVAAIPGMRGGGTRIDMHGMPDPAAIRYQQETLARGGVTGIPASQILQETLQRQSALAAVGVRSDFDRDALFQRTMQQQNVPVQEFSNIMGTLSGMRTTAIERNTAPRKEALSSILEAAAYAGVGSPDEALDYMANTSEAEQIQNAIKRGYLTDPAMINYVAGGLSPANRKQMYETLRAVGGGATEGQAKPTGELTLDPITSLRKLYENNKTWNAVGAQSDSEKLRVQAEVGDTIDSLAKAMRATIDALVEFGTDLLTPQSGAVWAGNVGIGTD